MVPQVEYRGFAHYSKCQPLIDLIKNGTDVHTGTAILVFGVKAEDAKKPKSGTEGKTFRDDAKTINFALIYGMGDPALAESLSVSKADACRFKMQYFDRMIGVEDFISNVKQVILYRGFVRNSFGRRRRLKPEERYKAVNALIQGWAADYIKHKLVDVYAFLRCGNYKSNALMVVHDEIDFEMHKSERHIYGKLRWLLSEFEEYRVPITAGVEVGTPDWGHKEEIDVEFVKPTDEELKDIEEFNFWDGHVFDEKWYCG